MTDVCLCADSTATCIHTWHICIQWVTCVSGSYHKTLHSMGGCHVHTHPICLGKLPIKALMRLSDCSFRVDIQHKLGSMKLHLYDVCSLCFVISKLQTLSHDYWIRENAMSHMNYLKHKRATWVIPFTNTDVPSSVLYTYSETLNLSNVWFSILNIST